MTNQKKPSPPTFFLRLATYLSVRLGDDSVGIDSPGRLVSPRVLMPRVATDPALPVIPSVLDSVASAIGLVVVLIFWSWEPHSPHRGTGWRLHETSVLITQADQQGRREQEEVEQGIHLLCLQKN